MRHRLSPRPRPALLAAAVSLALVVPVAEAQFIVVETEDVPIERVIANVERRQTDPTHPAELLQLARLHALASTRSTVQVVPTPQFPGEFYEVWWGYLPRPLPWTGPGEQVVGELTPTQRNHIEQAVALYRQLLAATPDDLLAKLGLGWCLLRAGDRPAALPFLRDAANGTWANEKDRQNQGMAGSHAAEAAAYLLQALDPEADTAEIAELKARIVTIDRRPRAVTPLLVGLVDRPLHELVGIEATVRFDLDGSGFARRWPWPGPDAAWLVWDPTGRGDIRSGLQLFGAVTWWVFWDNGFQALGALDDDDDGRIAGPELDGLALWRDVDQDGRSDPGEVRPVTRHGIVSIGTEATFGPDGVLFGPDGARTADGRTLPIWDWVPESPGEEADYSPGPPNRR